jgi:hypothetical protein
MLITAGFAGRELDAEELSKLKTSNSRLPWLKCKAVRRGRETTRKDYVAARFDSFKCAFFGERISISTGLYVCSSLNDKSKSSVWFK